MHFLVIPKQRQGLTRMAKAQERHEQLLSHLMLVASKVAKQGTQAAADHAVQCMRMACSLLSHAAVACRGPVRRVPNIRE